MGPLFQTDAKIFRVYCKTVIKDEIDVFRKFKYEKVLNALLLVAAPGPEGNQKWTFPEFWLRH